MATCDVDAMGNGNPIPPFKKPGARFSKVPIIDGPVKLAWFTCTIEVSIVLHLT